MSESNDIVYQNKDVTSKVLAENFKNKSLNVYGLHLPRIVQVLPTNLPEITANELRLDNLFELEDGTIAVIDYESTYEKKHKIKYLQYIVRILERYRKEGNLDVQLRMIVIYTADVKPKSVETVYRTGGLQFEIEAAFLSMLDGEKIKEKLKRKVLAKETLSEEELMEFIVLPLTYQTKEAKQAVLQETIQLAAQITEEETMMFVLSGILVFSDKIIDDEISTSVKEWIRMTKVARLFEEEKMEAIRQTAKETAEKAAKETARKMLGDHELPIDKIAKYSGLTLEEVSELEKEMLQTV